MGTIDRVLVCAFLSCLLSSTAEAFTVAEVKARVEAAHPVKVLRAESEYFEDRLAVRLTVMDARGGDRNGAFAVTQILVDQETGELISGFYHTPTGAVVPGDGPEVQREGQEAASTGRTWR